MVGFPLDPPPEIEEIVDRAREPERALCVVPISLLRLVEELPEERVIQIRYRDDEPLDSSVFILQPYLDRQEPLLHLHLLAVILQHDRPLNQRRYMINPLFLVLRLENPPFLLFLLPPPFGKPEEFKGKRSEGVIVTSWSLWRNVWLSIHLYKNCGEKERTKKAEVGI